LTATNLQKELDALGNPTDAEFLQRFFKTYDGGYAAGDIFIGLRVPLTRKIASTYTELSLTEVEKLLESPIHEHRLAALVVMVNKTKKATESQKQQLYELYLKRTDRINNWDLVDLSCRDIVGGYLNDKPKDPLYKLAKSKDIWERRIAIVSTWQFIREKQLSETFKIAEMLLNDTHDLIHKAVGWMLREAGKRDETALLKFLDKHAASMPRTTLRYSLERLKPEDRLYYMKLKAK
jgi:3-methyladenine DNA glycosylase AlkD